MSKIMYFVIPLLVITVFFIVKKANKKAEKNMDENSFKVRQPMIFIWIGIICALFFSALLVYSLIFPDDTTDWVVYLIFSIFAVLGIFLTIYCIVWELRIEGDHIVYMPFVGIKRNYSLNSITRIKLYNNQKVKAYAGEKKLFSVEPTSRGYNVLISRLKKEQIYFDVELKKLGL